MKRFCFIAATLLLFGSGAALAQDGPPPFPGDGQGGPAPAVSRRTGWAEGRWFWQNAADFRCDDSNRRACSLSEIIGQPEKASERGDSKFAGPDATLPTRRYARYARQSAPT